MLGNPSIVVLQQWYEVFMKFLIRFMWVLCVFLNGYFDGGINGIFWYFDVVLMFRIMY